MNKVLGIVFALTFFSSCMKPDSKNETISNFLLEEISGNSSKPISHKNGLSTKDFEFKVCLKNKKSLVEIRKEKFIVSGGKFNQKVISDVQGCFYWYENLSYQSHAPSEYITIKRKIKGRGNYKGHELLSLAINPWARSREELSREIIDLRFGRIAPVQSNKKNTVLIGLEEYNISITRNGMNNKETILNYTITAKPYAYTWLINGSNQKESIEKGLINLTIISYTNSQKKIQCRERFKTVEIVDGMFTINGKLLLSNYTSSDTLIQLIKIDSNQMMGINENYSAIFPIAPIAELVGNHSVSSSISSIYNSRSITSVMKEMMILNTRRTDVINFDTMEFAFEGFSAGESATARTIHYSVKTCASYDFDGSPIKFSSFSVYDATKLVVTVNSDHKGCFVWNNSLNHKYYKAEKYFVKHFNIKHIESSFKKELKAFINPWDFGWILGHDGRSWKDSDMLEFNEQTKSRSQLFMEEFSYQTLRFRYEIGNSLNLIVKKAVLLDVEPEVIRYNSLKLGRNAIEPLRDGIYLLKVAIQKDYLDNKSKDVRIKYQNGGLILNRERDNREREYIDTVQKLVRVQAGHIITPIEIEMEDLRLMRIRCNFLVQLQTIDESLLQLGLDMSIHDLEPARVKKLMTELYLKEKDSTYNQNVKAFKEQGIFTISTDYNLLVDYNSGLSSRTFVGPVVFLSNDIYADVRPTDNLEEVRCDFIDCDSLDENETVPEYDKDIDTAKYYGSVKHFENITIDDLIKRQRILDIEQDNERHYNRLLSNYLDRVGLSYYSITGKKLRTLNDTVTCQSTDLRECMRDGQESDNQLGLYLENARVEKEDLVTLVNNGDFSKRVAKGICRYWIKELIGKSISLSSHEIKQKYSKGPFALLGSGNEILNQRYLAELICRSNPDQAFQITQHLRVKDVANYFYRGGKALNINVGGNYELESVEEISSTTTFEMDALGWLNSIDNIFTSILGNVFSYTKDWAATESSSEHEGVTISSETFLVMQQASFDIKMNSFERCLEVRLNPDWSYLRQHGNYFNLLDKEDIEKSVSKGIFFCTGKLEQEETLFRERYYYFTQHFTEGDMLDDADLANAPWLIALRGEGQYGKFVDMLRSDPREIDNDTSFMASLVTWQLDNKIGVMGAARPVNLAEIPLMQLNHAYRQVMPTFPGIYTIRPTYTEFPYD